MIYKTLLWWWETCNFWGNANQHYCTEWTKDENKNHLHYFIYKNQCQCFSIDTKGEINILMNQITQLNNVIILLNYI